MLGILYPRTLRKFDAPNGMYYMYYSGLFSSIVMHKALDIANFTIDGKKPKGICRDSVDRIYFYI